MRSVKHELERQRASLARAITAGTDAIRASDAFRELARDPYGNASAIHDEEIATELVQRRARELQEVKPGSGGHRGRTLRRVFGVRRRDR